MRLLWRGSGPASAARAAASAEGSSTSSVRKRRSINGYNVTRISEVTKTVTRLTHGGLSCDQAGAGARHAASPETIEELKLRLNTSLTCHLVFYNKLEKSK
jgi:hypothetical protein